MSEGLKLRLQGGTRECFIQPPVLQDALWKFGLRDFGSILYGKERRPNALNTECVPQVRNSISECEVQEGGGQLAFSYALWENEARRVVRPQSSALEQQKAEQKGGRRAVVRRHHPIAGGR